MARRRARRGFGAIRQLPSKRYQASYVGPDLERHKAPDTFDTREDAEAWLTDERRLTASDAWTPPAARRNRTPVGLTLADYAPTALDRRRVRGEPLRPRTRALYDSILARVVLPDLGHLTLRQITPDVVRSWYDGLDPQTPTQRAHAYGLLRTIYNQAAEDGTYTGTNPCQVRGAGQSRRRRRIDVATPQEIVTIAQAMPERLRLLVLLAGWCGFRYGEAAELRRADIDLKRGTITVSRAVTRVHGADVVGPPKSSAGIRTVAVPPHLLPVIKQHLADHVAKSPQALLFPRHLGGEQHVIHTELTKKFAKARAIAGRPDLRLHDMRHTSAVLAAQSGATLAELMARLGHSTPAMAIRYQHAAQGRDAEIAERLSRLAVDR